MNTQSFQTYYEKVRGLCYDNDPSLLEKRVKEELSFSYDNDGGGVKELPYTICYPHFSNKGFVGRKFTALPFVLYTLASAVGHAVYALFFCMSNHHFRIHFYHAGRDLQRSWGHIVTIFTDRYGSFLVQKALFHKACYTLFQNNVGKPAPIHYDFTSITVRKFQEMEEPQKKKVLEALGKPNLFLELTTLDHDHAELITLEDVANNAKVFEYATILPTALAQKPIMECKNIVSKEIQVVEKRLQEHLRETIDSPAIAIPSWETCTLGAFYAARGTTLKIHQRQIPMQLFGLLRPAQAAQLDLNQCGPMHLVYLTTNDKASQLFHLLSDTQLNLFAKKMVIGLQHLRAIPQGRLGAIDFSQLPPDKRIFIFQGEEGDRATPETMKERFAFASNINGFAHTLSLNELPLLSDIQLQQLDLTKLDSAVVENWVQTNPNPLLLKKIGLLSPEEKASVLAQATGQTQVILTALIQPTT